MHVIPYTSIPIGVDTSIDDTFTNYAMPILDQIIIELEHNPDYKFNWSELGWLQRWWFSSEQTLQNRLKSLITKGQL